MYCIEPFLHSTAVSSSATLGAKCAYPVYNMCITSYTLEKEQLESAVMEVTGICTCSWHLLLMVLYNVFSRHTVILAISFSQCCGHSTQSNPQHSVKPAELKAKPCVVINCLCVIVFSVSERRRKKLLVKSKLSLFEREYTLFSQSSLQSRVCSTV